MLPLCCSKPKTYAKHMLGLSLGLCSLWLVWDMCLKFLSKATTTVREKNQNDYLPLPHFLLCNRQRYNTNELAAMDLPDDFFDNRYPNRTMFSKKDSFPDLNASWQRATWPRTEFEVDWNRYEGRAK